MTHSKRREKFLKAEYNRRIGEMKSIRSELQSAYSLFNNVTDPDIMDACIFEISALQSRYNYAVNNVRKLEID